MNRCSFREWILILPWPVWPLAGQFLLGQNVVVGSMIVLLAVCGSIPRGECLDPIFVTSGLYHGQVQSYLPLCIPLRLVVTNPMRVKTGASLPPVSQESV